MLRPWSDCEYLTIQRAGLTAYTQVVAAVVGILVALTTRTSLLGSLGFTVTPWWLDSLWMGLTLASGGWALNLLKKLGLAKVNGTKA